MKVKARATEKVKDAAAVRGDPLAKLTAADIDRLIDNAKTLADLRPLLKVLARAGLAKYRDS
jgi:hypothetical protein